jgi:hypothetical protein
LQDGHNITCENVTDLVKRCNIIVVGTDTMPIPPEAYAHMREGTYIATVTSADDSLGLDELINAGVLTRFENALNGRVTQYHGPKGQIINLIQNGEAPNLKTGIGVDDTTIFLPNTEHILLGRAMLQQESVSALEIDTIRRQVLEAHIQACREMQTRARIGRS